MESRNKTRKTFNRPFRSGYRLLAVTAILVSAGMLPAAGRTGTGYPPATSVDTTVTLPGEPTLQDYLTYAARRNPGLRAAFYQWRTALERVTQVRSLPDPKFTYGYFIRPIETRVGPQKHRLELGQMFPWFGKLKAKGEVAFRHAEMKRYAFEAARLELFYKVKNLYYEYYFTGQALTVTRENIGLLQYWEKVIAKRYASALAGQPDLIKTQIELSKLEDQALTLENGLSTVEAQLRSVLNYRDEAPLPVPREVNDPAVTFDRDAVTAALTDRNPELLAQASMVAREETKKDLAQRQFYPDVMLGITYLVTGAAANPGMLSPGESGTDPLMVMASVNLPLWYGKNRTGVQEAEAARETADAMRQNRENMLRAQAVKILNALNDQQRQAGLYREDLIPQARMALKTVEAMYMSGKKDILNVIDLERTLLQFQLMGVRAHSRYLQKCAELEMLTGGAEN